MAMPMTFPFIAKQNKTNNKVRLRAARGTPRPTWTWGDRDFPQISGDRDIEIACGRRAGDCSCPTRSRSDRTATWTTRRAALAEEEAAEEEEEEEEEEGEEEEG